MPYSRTPRERTIIIKIPRESARRPPRRPPTRYRRTYSSPRYERGG